MADANIFQQYLKPVKTVQDYQNDAMKQEGNQLQLVAARLQSQQGQQAMTDDKAMRDAYSASGGDQNKLIQMLTQGGQFKQVEALRKSALEGQKISADIGQTGAQTLKINTEADKKADAIMQEAKDRADKIK